MKKTFFKVSTCALAMLACMDLTAAPDEVSYSRQRLFSGFDGKTCKIQPSIATDGSGMVLLSWQNLLLTGSDVFALFLFHAGDDPVEIVRNDSNTLGWGSVNNVGAADSTQQMNVEPFLESNSCHDISGLYNI